MSIFERYAPFIQDFIYQNDWESLRAIQVAAGDAIFNTDENVLLSASTASGKTEAAFFPILTQFYEDPPTSVGAIYIGPLKALINDQFLRLAPCFYRSIFGNVALNVTIVRCAVFGFFNFTGKTGQTQNQNCL